MTENSVGNGVNGTSWQEITEDADVGLGVLVGQVELLTSEAALGRVGQSDSLDFETVGNVVVELDLGGKEGCGGPGLGEIDTCSFACD